MLISHEIASLRCHYRSNDRYFSAQMLESSGGYHIAYRHATNILPFFLIFYRFAKCSELIAGYYKRNINFFSKNMKNNHSHVPIFFALLFSLISFLLTFLSHFRK